MKKIFIDTDIFLDTILDRKPYSEFSNELLSYCEQNKVSGFTSSLILANIYYIIRKLANHRKAIEALRKIRVLVKVLPFTDKEIGESINAEFSDFEDGLQYFIASNHRIECVITRNTKDFKKSNISVLTPKEFLLTLEI
ncbi:MAG: PIN domain-containing protein [Candidatus Omnitrophica bacterium]|nr:PIN domain-containing protein [Candidatus Omnitrophota bacterium]